MAELRWRAIDGGMEATSAVIYRGHACIHVIRARGGKYHLSGSEFLYPGTERLDSFADARTRANAVEAEAIERAKKQAESDPPSDEDRDEHLDDDEEDLAD